MKEFVTMSSMWTMLLATILGLLSAEATFGASEPFLPPNLAHIAAGFGYISDCKYITFLGQKGKPFTQHLRVCRVTATAPYDDGSPTWTKLLAEISNPDPDKALHQANAVGEKWMAMVRKAVVKVKR